MISYDDKSGIFKLTTANTAYAFQIVGGKYPVHLYYGKKLAEKGLEKLREGNIYGASVYYADAGMGFSPDVELWETACSGCGDFRTPSLRISEADGACDQLFTFENYSTAEGKPVSVSGLPLAEGADCSTLTLDLVNRRKNLLLRLFYTIYETSDVICRRSILINRGTEQVRIGKMASLLLDLDRGDGKILKLHGTYGLEAQPELSEIASGNHSFGSVRGITGHEYNPFFAVCSPECGENGGEVYAFNLFYSGNFLNEVELSHHGTLRIVSGINPSDFSEVLKPGESFETPEAISLYTDGGLGDMSGKMHAFIRNYVLPKKYASVEKPVLLNTWEAFFFDYDEKKILDFARKAKDSGIELVVIDDGWFRKNDSYGLGDWKEDLQRFPDGLKGMFEKLRAMGLKTGLWFEPEMVSERSDFFAGHEDWVLGKTGERFSSRNQLTIDFSKPEAVDFIYRKIADVIAACKADYVKLDMNRPLTNVFSLGCEREKQGGVFHRYVLGYYSFLQRLTRDFPDLLIENCCSGGGRVDLGTMKYSSLQWISDNTNAYDRTLIQYGLSFAYPPDCMSGHVTFGGGPINRDAPAYFKYLVASSVNLGYELDLNKLSEEERRRIKEEIAEFKNDASLISNGRFFRLYSPFEKGGYEAHLYVSESGDEALLYFIQLNAKLGKEHLILRLKGLLLEKKYELCDTGEIYDGSVLSYAGFRIDDLIGSSRASKEIAHAPQGRGCGSGAKFRFRMVRD